MDLPHFAGGDVFRLWMQQLRFPTAQPVSLSARAQPTHRFGDPSARGARVNTPAALFLDPF